MTTTTYLRMDRATLDQIATDLGIRDPWAYSNAALTAAVSNAAANIAYARASKV